jgi:UDP-2,3-diacylglucosamine pyrophosphatase LpxH
MLLIISDIHLGDGTTAKSIPSSAFKLFANRLQEMAYFASWRTDGRYEPIESIDLILMGDILDPLHSTRWLATAPGDENYIRPWSDPTKDQFPVQLREVTNAILEQNKESLEVLRNCATGKQVNLPPVKRNGEPDYESQERIPLKVRSHYMVGNHDWYYHLPGEAIDQIRQDMIDTLGLSNLRSNFPYDPDEYLPLKDILNRYKVFGRHGDCYDNFNFNREKGRDHATLGDVFTMEVLNRFPVEVQKRFGEELPEGIVDSLRRLTNIRPVLAAPLWISGQIQNFAGNKALEEELKDVWEDICEEFLQTDYVRDADKFFQFDIVDAMEIAVNISRRTSFDTINEVVSWAYDKFGGEQKSFAEHALQEPAFLDNSARYIAYGHTHHHEIVPLDEDNESPHARSQIYFNSGTWHSYYALAIKNPREQNFVPYQAMTYLTFYKGDERNGLKFETWAGAYA